MNKNPFSENEEQHGRKASREVGEDAAAQLTKIKRAGMNAGAELGTYVKKQPLAAVGIALGTGFVLGSLFGSRLARMALVGAVGYVAQELIEGALGEGGVRKLVVDEVSKLTRGRTSAS
jgi:hypothetical protein